MGEAISGFFKSIVAPLAIALLLYVLLFHVVLPLHRRHRARYGDYTPMLPESVTSRFGQYIPTFVSTPFEYITDRLSNSLILHLFTPSSWHARNSAGADSSYSWRYNPEAARHGMNPFLPRATDEEEEVFDEEEGEGMVGFDVRHDSDSPAVPRPADRERYAHTAMPIEREDSGRRLSRELEEGFRDDSDDDGGDGDGRRTIPRTGVGL